MLIGNEQGEADEGGDWIIPGAKFLRRLEWVGYTAQVDLALEGQKDKEHECEWSNRFVSRKMRNIF